MLVETHSTSTTHIMQHDRKQKNISEKMQSVCVCVCACGAVICFSKAQHTPHVFRTLFLTLTIVATIISLFSFQVKTIQSMLIMGIRLSTCNFMNLYGVPSRVSMWFDRKASSSHNFTTNTVQLHSIGTLRKCFIIFTYLAICTYRDAYYIRSIYSLTHTHTACASFDTHKHTACASYFFVLHSIRICAMKRTLTSASASSLRFFLLFLYFLYNYIITI